MTTDFLLQPESACAALDIAAFQQTLPKFIRLNWVENALIASVESSNDEDPSCQYLIDRELDRLCFFTSVALRAKMQSSIKYTSTTVAFRVYGKLPNGLSPQKWTYELALQLRLWSLATDEQDLVLKFLLLFQVIELAYPTAENFPTYNDSHVRPHPRTECKLLRNLVVHSGDVTKTQLRKYCEYLELPSVMFDRADPSYSTLIRSKLPLLRREAQQAIATALGSVGETCNLQHRQS